MRTKAVAVSILVVMLFALCFPWSTAAYVNFTESAPPGIYIVSNKPITKWHYVSIPSENIKLNQNVVKLPTRLTKKVVGVAGDYVQVCDSGVFVNGAYLGKVRRVKGIPDLTFSGYIEVGQIFVVNDNPKSFDSRFFGPVSESGVVPIEPFLLFPSEHQ